MDQVLVSMTVLTVLLFVIYGHRVAPKGFGTYQHLLPTAASLPLTMLVILTEGVTGLHGYFHFHSLQNMAATMPSASNIVTPTASNLLSHMGGQILVAIPFTFLGWGLASMGFLLSRYLTFLRNAFLMLAALGIFRVLIGAVGVPEYIGTWISSLSLLMMVLAVYYGHSARRHGFDRYWQVVLMGLLLSTVQSLVVIACILNYDEFRPRQLLHFRNCLRHPTHRWASGVCNRWEFDDPGRNTCRNWLRHGGAQASLEEPAP